MLDPSSTFGIGTTDDNFQVLGNLPDDMHLLKNLVNPRAMLYAVDFNMIAEIPSGPLALDVSRLSNKSMTSSSKHRKSSGQERRSNWNCSNELLSSCGTAVLIWPYPHHLKPFVHVHLLSQE